MPPSWLISVLRWKPVAIFCSSVALGQQVAGELLDREPVERQVAVEGVDDPVAVLPDRARGVDAVAVGVGVAGQVEPVPRPALAVVRRGEQAVDEPLVGVGRGRRRGTRRPPRAIGGRPIRSRLTRRISVARSASGDGAMPVALQPGEDEAIDRVADPVASAGRPAARADRAGRRPSGSAAGAARGPRRPGPARRRRSRRGGRRPRLGASGGRFRGIRSPSPSPRTARTSGLSSAWPGTTDGPPLPPASRRRRGVEPEPARGGGSRRGRRRNAARAAA